MTTHARLLEQIRTGQADANVGFLALCSLLRALGFAERRKGSHHIFGKADVAELINLQRSGASAKVYQVRQVRKVLLKYGIRNVGESE